MYSLVYTIDIFLKFQMQVLADGFVMESDFSYLSAVIYILTYVIRK